MKSFKFTNPKREDRSLDDTYINFEDFERLGPLRFELDYGEKATMFLVSKDSPELRYEYLPISDWRRINDPVNFIFDHAKLHLPEGWFKWTQDTKYIILNLAINISETPQEINLCDTLLSWVKTIGVWVGNEFELHKNLTKEGIKRFVKLIKTLSEITKVTINPFYNREFTPFYLKYLGGLKGKLNFNELSYIFNSSFWYM